MCLPCSAMFFLVSKLQKRKYLLYVEICIFERVYANANPKVLVILSHIVAFQFSEK